MSDKNYKFFMQPCDINGTPTTDDPEYIADLEESFNELSDEGDVLGELRYSRCEGIDNIGKVKNIYTETYSDADRLRVYIPEIVQNEPTVITLTLFFFGKERALVRDNFNEYIRHGFHKYWDDARNKEFVFFVQDELPIGEEMWYGSKPYLKCEYKLRNVKGKTEIHENKNLTK